MHYNLPRHIWLVPGIRRMKLCRDTLHNILSGPGCRFGFTLVVWICVYPPAARSSTSVLEPQFLKSESYTQVYTLTALFSDSSLVQIQFVLTNLGMSDRNGACKIILVSGAQKPLVWNRKYAADQWHYRAESGMQVLAVGPNRISLHDGLTHVVAGDNKLQAEVTFGCLPDKMFPPDSRISAKGRFFEYAVALRWMPVHVSLRHGNASFDTLAGHAMLEMSRSTSFPSDICRGWLTFRGYRADAAFNANIRLPPGNNAAPAGWVWDAREPAPASIGNLMLDIQTPKGMGGKPTLRKVTALDSSFIIVPQALLCRYSFIDELGPILGAIVKLVVGAPVVYFYRSETHLPGHAVAVPGILEYIRIE